MPDAKHRVKRDPPVSGAAVRAAAARVVHEVRAEGRSLTDALERETPAFAERDAALLKALSFGTLRLLPRLEALVAILLMRPLQRGDRVLQSLMAVGLYQLTEMRIPPHAAVAATVAAVRVLGRPRAAGLINATLRRFQRERTALLAGIADEPAVQWLFPDWLLRRLQEAWPGHWQAIIGASNARAPMTLRVNRTRIERDAYGRLLAEHGLTARALPHLDAALVLDRPVASRSLPGFDAGLVSVQDASAQYAATLLDAQPGERVLDACAAPGGKTAHILERSGGRAEVTAVDVDPERLDSLRQTLERLGLAAHCLAADATEASSTWPGAPYHRILLDAPCSASGVVRRHPDIKWLRRDADIAALAATQRALLDALWPLLVPGGLLLYVTCSLLPEENDVQVAAFLQRHLDARERPIDAGWGLPRSPGRQLLPEYQGGDGFYFALLEKAPTESAPAGPRT